MNMKWISELFKWMLRWVIFPLLWILLILTAGLLICLVISHICFFTDTKIPPIVKTIAGCSLRMLGCQINNLEDAKYAAIVSDMLVILAFLLTAAPFIQAVYFQIQYKRKFREEQGIESFKVKTPGQDDLEKMLEYYKEAEKLTVFCGSFDWIGKNETMKNKMLALAKENKLTLVSYKSEQDVQSAFNEVRQEDLFNQLKHCFKFESGLPEVKCSMIKRIGAEQRFLFRQSSNQNPFNACVLSSTNQSRELLYILSKVTDAAHWGKPPSNAGQASH
jgi:hypothetical protein